MTAVSCKKSENENGDNYCFTDGSIKENGDIQIEMGANLYDRGYHQSISGYKIN